MGLQCSEWPHRGLVPVQGRLGLCERGQSLSSLPSQTFPSVWWQFWWCWSQPHCPFVASAASPLGGVSPPCLSKLCSGTTESSPALLLPSPAQQSSQLNPCSGSHSLHAPTLQGRLYFHPCSPQVFTWEELPHSSFTAHSFFIFITEFPVIQISSGSFIKGGCGTKGHDLVAVLGFLVDSTLKAFSNRKVSVIPAGTCSKRIPVTIHCHFHGN